MSATGTVLASIALKTGLPILKKILNRRLGSSAGDMAEIVVETVADRLGVEKEIIPDLPEERVRETLIEVEQEMPEILAQHTAMLKQSHQLMLAEMEKEGPFHSAWRPGMMWLLAYLWFWNLFLAPVINAITAFDISIDTGTLVTITGLYLALYMGGHTVKEVVKRK